MRTMFAFVAAGLFEGLWTALVTSSVPGRCDIWTLNPHSRPNDGTAPFEAYPDVGGGLGLSELIAFVGVAQGSILGLETDVSIPVHSTMLSGASSVQDL